MSEGIQITIPGAFSMIAILLVLYWNPQQILRMTTTTPRQSLSVGLLGTSLDLEEDLGRAPMAQARIHLR